MRRMLVALLGPVLLISACDHAPSPPAPPSTSVAPSTPGATSRASSPPKGASSVPPQTIHVSRTANNTTVSVHVGDELDVSLDSTYWRFTTQTSAVLHPVGTPASVPGPGCVPGSGCGTITARYRAVAVGRALVSADRALCGEALQCNGIQHFQVTVVVGS